MHNILTYDSNFDFHTPSESYLKGHFNYVKKYISLLRIGKYNGWCLISDALHPLSATTFHHHISATTWWNFKVEPQLDSPFPTLQNGIKICGGWLDIVLNFWWNLPESVLSIQGVTPVTVALPTASWKCTKDPEAVQRLSKQIVIVRMKFVVVMRDIWWQIHSHCLLECSLIK